MTQFLESLQHRVSWSNVGTAARKRYSRCGKRTQDDKVTMETVKANKKASPAAVIDCYQGLGTESGFTTVIGCEAVVAVVADKGEADQRLEMTAISESRVSAVTPG